MRNKSRWLSVLLYLLAEYLVPYKLCHFVSAASHNQSDVEPPLQQGNGNSNLSFTPWPQTPFSVPLGAVGRPGDLTFDTVGHLAQAPQTFHFYTFTRALKAYFLYHSRHFDFVGIVLDNPVLELQAYFFTFDMKAKAGVPYSPTGWDDYYLIRAIEKQTRKHGLAEFNSNIDRSRLLDGGVQLLLEPITSMPISDLMLLYVPRTTLSLMMEIIPVRAQRRIDRTAKEQVLGEAVDWLTENTYEPFRIIGRTSENLKFEMQLIDGTVASQHFTCGFAAEVVGNLRLLEDALPIAVQFNVQAKIEGDSFVVARGSLVYTSNDVGQGDTATVNTTSQSLTRPLNTTIDMFS